MEFENTIYILVESISEIDFTNFDIFIETFKIGSDLGIINNKESILNGFL